MIYELQNTEKASSIFEGWQDSVVWSALEGVMGKIYVDSLEIPKSGAVILGDFCFLSGEPSQELLCFRPAECEGREMILVPQNQKWSELIEKCYGERAKKTVRYAIKKEPGIFNLKKLQEAADTLQAGYKMKLIDKELFEITQKTEWSKDFTANYINYEQYEKFGLGVAVLKDQELVAGVSSYSGYHGGIEIEVVTREDHRKKGLAYAGAARLLLECEKRGLYPNWDAANKMSVGLAEKLGYHFSHEYFVYKCQCIS